MINKNKSEVYPGFYRAEVVENFDPEGLGRIRIRFFHLEQADENKLPYAEYCSPFGGGGEPHQGAGFFMVPNKGDIVWIGFEAGDPNRPVYFGSVFTNGEAANSHPPMEAFVKDQSPNNRVIKSSTGHRIELDDRLTDVTGEPTSGIRITSSMSKALWLDDAHNVVKLSNGIGQPHQLLMNKNGLKLESGRGTGLYFKDNPEPTILLSLGNKKGLLSMDNEEVALISDGFMSFHSNQTKFTTDANVEFETGGQHIVKAASTKLITSADMSFSSGNNFSIVANNNIGFTGGGTSNFLVDMPAPGIPQVSGNIMMNSTLGTVGMRVGLKIPNPVSPIGMVVTDPLLNDPGGRLGRFAIGTTGAVVLEGLLGGIYLSPIPMPHPGSAMGGGGRIGGGNIPLAPIIPSPLPAIGPQPAVLGGNLQMFLNLLMIQLQVLTGVLIASAPSISVSPVGPTVLNPAAAAALTLFQTQLLTLQTTYLGAGGAAPAPATGILSSVVHLDG